MTAGVTAGVTAGGGAAGAVDGVEDREKGSAVSGAAGGASGPEPASGWVIVSAPTCGTVPGAHRKATSAAPPNTAATNAPRDGSRADTR